MLFTKVYTEVLLYNTNSFSSPKICSLILIGNIPSPQTALNHYIMSGSYTSIHVERWVREPLQCLLIYSTDSIGSSVLLSIKRFRLEKDLSSLQNPVLLSLHISYSSNYLSSNPNSPLIYFSIWRMESYWLTRQYIPYLCNSFYSSIYLRTLTSWLCSPPMVSQ